MHTENNRVPTALRRWFVVHCIADIIFALPMFIAPESFLTLMGWKIIDPVTTRMVAAALFGIGIESLLCRNAGVEAFKTMLNLKIIWSLSAVTGLLIALVSGLFGSTTVGIILLVIFLLFNILWVYWRARLQS